MDKTQIRTYRDLDVYQLSFALAMKLFKLSAGFPKEETYGLTDQIRRASRSIPANIAEGWAKRCYKRTFRRHLLDSIGSCEEMKVWLEFSLECNYLTDQDYNELRGGYARIGAMLQSLLQKLNLF